ncbi:HNH endonuclease family protein [Natronoglycomyces albus]|uniref:HNH endonuclease n=1 Tax=Natronoglycomyces albus TaxID=2811108 RepID=A0A895XVJ7_9ACTN|nr:HNH endonuclease family protein [Natronoglycomyces albus]QSB06546.1 HNH endonuclease [Natronoglycomyces albus]
MSKKTKSRRSKKSQNKTYGAILAAIIAIVALYGANTSGIFDDATNTGDGPREVNVEGLSDAIDDLTVAEDHIGGYDRALFPHWSDLDGSGCHARERTLLNEDLSGNLTEEDCGSAMAGEWTSWFDGDTATNSPDFDVDHIVPLAEAWRSGAHEWSTEKREEFANDQDNLTAVSASSNRSKGDSDPADWMPPAEEIHCEYVAVWVDVKLKWDLTANPGEHQALTEIAANC